MEWVLLLTLCNSVTCVLLVRWVSKLRQLKNTKEEKSIDKNGRKIKISTAQYMRLEGENVILGTTHDLSQYEVSDEI